MRVAIANPIYDVVFKYMIEDNAVARLLISSIIGEEVVSLDFKPQERAKDLKKFKFNNATANSSGVYMTVSADKYKILEPYFSPDY